MLFQRKKDRQFLNHLETLLDEVAVVTISGSLPKGLPDDYYVKVIKKCKDRNIKVILDTSGSVLKNVMDSKVKPFAIKPNIDELKGLFSDSDFTSEKAIREALQSEKFSGIECVMVSDGSKGSYVKWEENSYKVTIPKVDAVNPVGSGDATVAGLASALENKQSVEEGIKTAMTTGVLNALNEKTGSIDATDFDAIFDQITVEALN